MDAPKNQRKISCNCGNGANWYNRFGGNGAIRGLFEELATNGVRDHHLLMVVWPWTRVQSSAWVVTDTIESQRTLSPKAMVPTWSEPQDNENLRVVTEYIKSKSDKKVRFSPSQLHQNMLP